MADTANENEQIREVIRPEIPAEDNGLELLDLDNNGIPDLLEDDEDVDAASDAQRIYAAVSHRTVTMTVDSEDSVPANSSPYYVTSPSVSAAFEDEEADDGNFEDDGFDEDDYEDDEDDTEEDYGPSVAPAFRPDAPAGTDERDELPIINGRRVERRKKPRAKKDPEFDLTHPDYTFTITKGLTNTVVKRKYLPHNRAMFTVVAFFIALLALLCFFVFSVVYIIGNEHLKRTQASAIEQLEKENELLASKNNELSSTVTQLSRSVNRSIEDRRADEVAYEASLIPDAYPLSQSAELTIGYETERTADGPETAAGTGASDETQNEADAADSADPEDDDAAEETPRETGPRNPVALFSAEAGTRVLAAGGGAVTRVTEDDVYGYRVMIDHRNGYQSIYRCAGEPQVAVGITVMRGDTLFVVEEVPDTEEPEEEPADDAAEDTSEETGDDAESGDEEDAGTKKKASFAYQILLNGNYINPGDLMQNP